MSRKEPRLGGTMGAPMMMCPGQLMPPWVVWMHWGSQSRAMMTMMRRKTTMMQRRKRRIKRKGRHSTSCCTCSHVQKQ